MIDKLLLKHACDFSVSPSPFGLDFGTWDFGTWDSGLTIEHLDQVSSVYASTGSTVSMLSVFLSAQTRRCIVIVWRLLVQTFGGNLHLGLQAPRPSVKQPIRGQYYEPVANQRPGYPDGASQSQNIGDWREKTDDCF